MPRSEPSEEVPIPSYDESHTRRLLEKLIEPGGWKMVRIDESDSRTPDMWLRKGDTAILSELKTPELHLNLKHGLFLFWTEFGKVAKHLHKSVKQLRAFDEKREHPWLVTFVSYNFQLGFDSFVNAVQGGFAPGDGNIYPPGYRESRPHKQLLNDLKEVDAVLWLQAHRNPSGRMRHSVVLDISEHLLDRRIDPNDFGDDGRARIPLK